jgi:DNA-directed RNA polymerase specialized sigma24 family protein
MLECAEVDIRRDPEFVASAFVRGEDWSFEEMRRRLTSKLRLAIREVLHDMPQHIDEAEAETWVTAFSTPRAENASFRELTAWLRRIAINKAIDIRRKRSREQQVEDWDTIPISDAIRAEHPEDAIELKLDLSRALLKMRQRTLLIAVLEEIAADRGSLTDAFARAAERLEKSPDYVKRIFYELRPMLAGRLGPDWSA